MWPCSQQLDMAGDVDLGLPKPDLDMAFPNEEENNENAPITQAISLSQDTNVLGQTTNHSIPRISADAAYQILQGTATKHFDQTLVLERLRMSFILSLSLNYMLRLPEEDVRKTYQERIINIWKQNLHINFNNYL